MQSGNFTQHPLMRLTLGLTLVFLAGFVVTNHALYFANMNLNPDSVVKYYNGSEEEFRQPRSYQSMLEVTHGHLAMMALVILLLTHLVIFAPFSRFSKVSFITVAFSSGLLNEASGWLVRFVDPGFSWLKVFSFVVLQSSLLFLLASLAWFLSKGRTKTSESSQAILEGETVDEVEEEEAQLP